MINYIPCRNLGKPEMMTPLNLGATWDVLSQTIYSACFQLKKKLEPEKLVAYYKKLKL